LSLCVAFLAFLLPFASHEFNCGARESSESFQSTSPLNASTRAGAELTASKEIFDAYGNLPLHFEANPGEAGGQVKYLSRGLGYTLFLTPTEAVLGLTKPAGDRAQTDEQSTGGSPVKTSTVLSMQLRGPNLTPEILRPDLNDAELAGWRDWVDVFANGRQNAGIAPRDIHHLIFGFIYSEEYRKCFGQPELSHRALQRGAGGGLSGPPPGKKSGAPGGVLDPAGVSVFNLISF
jgi:hypothetical protein